MFSIRYNDAMNDGFLSISELARLSRSTRDALLHYDHIGLISPISRGENNYRYYSDEQIATINLVHTLQSLGMPLSEIRGIVDNRTPRIMLELFRELSDQLKHNISELRRSERLLDTLRSTIGEAVDIDENTIDDSWHEAESIFLGPYNNYADFSHVNEALANFYKYCKEVDPDMNLNYSAWGCFSAERIKNHDWNLPDYFYFNRPGSPDEKPAGRYITGYGRGNYGQTDALYRRLMKYLDKHHLEITGTVFEAYPLNEIVITNPSSYLIRVSIPVKDADSK